MNFHFKIIFSVILISLLTSCASKKDVLYLQDIQNLAEQSEAMFSEPVLQPNDLLYIQVSAIDMETVAPFNLISSARGLLDSNTFNRDMIGYLITTEGTIDFPELGTLQVAGLTRHELTLKLKEDLSTYVKNPIVNITLANFKVTVLGEVLRPGFYEIKDERITLLEALGKAGDLTIFGRRDNIIILREQNGIKTHRIIDITKSDFLQSPYYFLQQNDVIYVQPNGPQINSSAYNRNAGVYISIASVLISIIVLISK